MSNYLDRLRADRAASMHTGPAQASVRRALDTGPGGPREAGRQAAAHDLTWHHVAALCALVPLARGHVLHWPGTSGTDRLRAMGLDTVADAQSFDSFADWAAWLEGVNDVAAAVEFDA